MSGVSTVSAKRPLLASVGSFARATLGVFRHEWRALIHSPLTPVFQAGFLLALAVAIFLIGDFLASDLATLDSLWTFLPWVALVFVPALAMRSFAEEAGNRGLEFILTLPVPLGAVVVGKWLAGVALLLTTLALTFPFVATVGYLGAPDWGLVFSGYLAAALMLATFFAVAMFAAALTRDQVVAFLLGLGFLFALLLLGWDAFGRLFGANSSAGLIESVSQLSPKYWLDRMAAGRVELGAIVYFAAAIALPLAGAAALLDMRRGGVARGQAGWWRRLAPMGLLAGGLVAIFAAGRMPLAADFTAEREFTLHRETVTMARGLPDGVTIDFFWSESQPSIPANIRAHARRARDLIKAIASRSGGKITVREADPRPDSDVEERAIAAGVRRVAMTSGESFLLGAAFSQGDRHGSISYFDVRREQLLEYDVALALNSLVRRHTPKVALLTPLLTPDNLKQPREGLAFMSELTRAYDVAIVPPFSDRLPDDLDVLVVANVSLLKRSMLYAIDQHVMAGKGLVVLMDPYARFGAASKLPAPGPSETLSDVSGILASYGVKYLGEGVVGDRRLAAPVLGKDESQISYPFWLRLPEAALSRAHAVTANLKELLFAEPGALELKSPRAKALISTTTDAGLLPRQVFDDAVPELMAASFKPDGKERVLAAAIEGPFASAFQGPPEGVPSEAHVAHSTKPSAVFVVADVDWIFDPVALQDVTAGERTFSRPLNDNHALLFNMIEFASGDARIIAIRSRGRLQRPFTRIAELLRAGQQRYHEQEAAILQRIAAVEENVHKILQISRVSRVEQLPADIEARIVKLRQELLPFRSELRATRQAMREGVESLQRNLAFINLLAGPLLVALLAVAFRLWRRRAAG